MQIGPAFRRFGVHAVLAVALLATGCSQVSEDAGTPPEDPGEEADTPATTAAPETSSPDTNSDVVEPEADSADDNAIPRRPAVAVEELGELAGELVFLDDNGAVVVSAPDGSSLATLSADDGSQPAQPTWSNDGTQVAWSTLGPTGATVSVANADGSNRVEIAAPTPAFFLAWSPDDARIAALGPNPQGVELFFASNESNESTRVGVGQPFFIDWADNASVVAAISGSVFAEISADDAANTQIDLPSPLGPFQAPAVLDADRTLLALSNGTGGNNLVVLDGDEVVTIAQAPGPVTFSPNPVNSVVAVLVNASTSQSQVISFQPDPAPTLPPNRVSIVDTNSDGEEVTTIDIEGVLAPQWSPDGNTLALLVADDNGLEWRFVRDGEVLPGDPFVPSQRFFSSYVPFADQYERSATWWSPDSRAIVFAGTIDGASGIFVDLVDDELGAAQVAEGDIAFWSPAPS